MILILDIKMPLHIIEMIALLIFISNQFDVELFVK